MLLLSPYLEGIAFKLQSGQNAMGIILNLRDASNDLAHWSFQLSKLEIGFSYETDIKVQTANVKLRLLTDNQEASDLNDQLPVRRVMQAKNASELIFHGEEWDIMGGPLKTAEVGLIAVYKIAVA